jgi:hypothetical protein
MSSPVPNLTPAECRQSEELNNQMMNCLRYNWILKIISIINLIFYLNSFQPNRCTSEFVRKQLQNTIHGRQKPTGGKDMSGSTGHNSLPPNLDSSKSIRII